jgi:hypothetical protein
MPIRRAAGAKVDALRWAPFALASWRGCRRLSGILKYRAMTIRQKRKVSSPVWAEESSRTGGGESAAAAAVVVSGRILSGDPFASGRGGIG